MPRTRDVCAATGASGSKSLSTPMDVAIECVEARTSNAWLYSICSAISDLRGEMPAAANA